MGRSLGLVRDLARVVALGSVKSPVTNYKVKTLDVDLWPVHSHMHQHVHIYPYIGANTHIFTCTKT